MEVVLGSNNEPKRLAVEQAFLKVFPNEGLTIEPVMAKSSVSNHPTSSLESISGAINRAKHSRKLRPGADYYVGIEGGLFEVDGRVWELGWVAIENSKGSLHTGLSAGIELKGKLLNAVLDGEELNQVLNEEFGLKDIGKANGFYGLATNDLVTRVGAYTDAVIFALAPFKSPDYFK